MEAFEQYLTDMSTPQHSREHRNTLMWIRDRFKPAKKEYEDLKKKYDELMPLLLEICDLHFNVERYVEGKACAIDTYYAHKKLRVMIGYKMPYPE